ncbi:hypothetical protein DER45DRAFT_149363 [Fusarium avenaceum]|nr:hypothetical protein DER45DRAFT_149363 [Fusarium avenaceum]
MSSTGVVFLLGEGFCYLSRSVSVLVGSTSSSEAADIFGARPYIYIILRGEIAIMPFSSKVPILDLSYMITLQLDTNSSQPRTTIPFTRSQPRSPPTTSHHKAGISILVCEYLHTPAPSKSPKGPKPQMRAACWGPGGSHIASSALSDSLHCT